jgi:Protein of unknown function (DUF1360)
LAPGAITTDPWLDNVGGHDEHTQTVGRHPADCAALPGRERPLGSHAVLIGTFSTLAGAYAAWFRRSGRELPERIDARDFVLLTVASHKAARLITKDRVTSAVRAPFTRFEDDAGPGEVDEAARGRGMRRAVGELLVCPYCMGMWTTAALVGSLLVAPRLTRWFASVLAMFFGSELLQAAYRRVEA